MRTLYGLKRGGLKTFAIEFVGVLLTIYFLVKFFFLIFDFVGKLITEKFLENNKIAKIFLVDFLVTVL